MNKFIDGLNNQIKNNKYKIQEYKSDCNYNCKEPLNEIKKLKKIKLLLNKLIKKFGEDSIEIDFDYSESLILSGYKLNIPVNKETKCVLNKSFFIKNDDTSSHLELFYDFYYIFNENKISIGSYTIVTYSQFFYFNKNNKFEINDYSIFSTKNRIEKIILDFINKFVNKNFTKQNINKDPILLQIEGYNKDFFSKYQDDLYFQLKIME
jgi:hypothetical protein